MSDEHKLADGRKCFGTAAIYAARPSHWIHVQGDYGFDLNGNTYPKETRAYRKVAKLRGKKRAVRANALRDETVVVFGPDVTAAAAITILRKLADQIKREGLYIGRDHIYRELFEKAVRQL